MYAAKSKASAVQVRMELATIKKKDSSAPDYYRKVKGLASTLAAVGTPLRDDEIISYLLAGLEPEYDSFVTSTVASAATITLDDLYAQFLAFEGHLQQRRATELQQQQFGASSANFARHGSHRGGRVQNFAPTHGGRNSGRTGGPNRGGGCTGGPIKCQICDKEGHGAKRCWYRNDDSYNDDNPPSANVAASYKINSDWYMDTGAMDHITSDLDRFAIREKYNGGDRVQVGNGAGLQIAHVGHCSINTASKDLALNNVLHVPEIKKKLISVNKMSRDNDVFFQFHPNYFLIKDQASKRTILEGRCESSLYPTKSSMFESSKGAFVSNKVPRLARSNSMHVLVIRPHKLSSLYYISINYLVVVCLSLQFVMHAN